MVAETNVRAMARRDEPVRDIDSIDLTAIERVPCRRASASAE
jgi:hypothetical protein